MLDEQKSGWDNDEGCTVSSIWLWLVDGHEGNHLHSLSAVTGLGSRGYERGYHLQAHFVG